ncbi:10337_t:CDS:1 [Entrophospora sp. SA101]|nr:10337_t:CDS:1 [Entrophospora sp. SA101]
MSLDISPMRRLSSMSNGPEILDTFTNTLLPPPKEFTTTSSNVFHSQPSTFKPFNQITSVSYALEQLSNTVLKNSISHKNDDDIINWLEGCDVNVEGMNSGMGGNDILETPYFSRIYQKHLIIQQNLHFCYLKRRLLLIGLLNYCYCHCYFC